MVAAPADGLDVGDGLRVGALADGVLRVVEHVEPLADHVAERSTSAATNASTGPSPSPWIECASPSTSSWAGDRACAAVVVDSGVELVAAQLERRLGGQVLARNASHIAAG